MSRLRYASLDMTTPRFLFGGEGNPAAKPPDFLPFLISERFRHVERSVAESRHLSILQIG